MLTSTKSSPSTGRSHARPADDPRRTTPVRAGWPAIGVAILLGASYALQCLWFIGTQSLVYDEPAHIIAGLDAWQHDRFELWNDQPPLARLLLTMPLLPGGDRWHIEKLGRIRPSPEAFAWHTRPVNVALGLTLAWLLWTTARRMFSDGGANLALALFAFSAPLVAHFSLATVDGAATLLLFATAVALLRWRARPFWAETVWLGIVLGGFLISKFSAPPMVALASGVMTMHRPAGRRLVHRVAKAGAALGVAFMVVWAAYFFHVGPVTFRNGSMSGPYAGPGAVIVPVDRPIDLTLTLPAPEYFAAFGSVAQHSVKGQWSFLMGHVRTRGGWRVYFPVVAALKWPVTTWAVVALTLVLFATRTIPWATEVGVMMMFPLVFFGLATLSNLDIGDRYILPVYPFLLVFCAASWNAGKRLRAIGPLLVSILVLHAGDALRYAPDYLSYFTPFVRPDRSYELLTDSNLDWGQGLLALRAYERSHPDEKISVAYFGGVDPREYGIRAQPLRERDRPAGTVVVSATHLSGQYLDDPNAYHWLLQFPRSTILNHTLHVFQVR
jgi:4-amino-4-deoxy-L-arabinose transferase-like glycosyltransferase